MMKHQTKIAPNVEISNYIHMDDMKDLSSTSEQKTPTALQMRITKSRLGNNTLK